MIDVSVEPVLPKLGFNKCCAYAWTMQKEKQQHEAALATTPSSYHLGHGLAAGRSYQLGYVDILVLVGIPNTAALKKPL